MPPKPDLILLAVDDPQISTLFEKAFAAASYQTAITPDRKLLEKALHESTPTVLLLGENFNGGSSVDLAGEILSRFPTMPVLLFVNSNSPEEVKAAMQIGVSDILSPPLRVEKIRQTVENSIKRAHRIGDWLRKEVKRTTTTLEQRLDDMQKLDTVLQNIDNGVIIIDPEDRVILINRAAKRDFGLWQEETLTGKPIEEVINLPSFKEILANGGIKSLQHSEITFDDGRVLMAQCTPIPGIGSTITVQDVTSMKQIDRLKTEFVNTVSHDLRSPLTAILGYVELLGRIGPLTNQQKDFVQRINANIETITLLVNDLLDLGRIEAGYDNQKSVVALDELLNTTMENHQLQANMRSQEILVKTPDHAINLRGNPIRLRQMLDNLIGNAIKYTPENGQISVELEDKDGQIILRVKDSGIGIPPADQPHIFNKFYRASNIPRGVGGSGLGLAIVKSIVDNHNGRIWVDSVIGQGSTFVVVLPDYLPKN